MNIEGLAHIALVCVIIVAVCSIALVVEVNADRADGVIDISEPTSTEEILTIETEPSEMVPEVTEAPTTPESNEEIVGSVESEKSAVIKFEDFVDTLRETIRATGKTVDDAAFGGYYKVPLSFEIQDHIFAVCEKYDIEPEIVIAMIRKESNFNPDTMGDGGYSYGLMQIQPKWHRERMERLGVTDLMDPCQNITVGVDYLAECIEMGHGSLDWGLMAYNGGPSYAYEMRAKGEVSYYARIVQKWAREYADN